MDTRKITIEKILQEILQEDRSILLDHKTLIEKARGLVPPDSMRDFRSIEKAFDSHIGEQLLTSDRTNDKEHRTKTLQNIKLQLQGTGLQEKRADYVIHVLEAALEWDKEPAEDAGPTQPDAQEAAAKEEEEKEKEEEELLPLPKERPLTEADTPVDTTWLCSCGVINDGNFCRHCGKQKTDERSNMFLPGTTSIQEEEQKKTSIFSHLHTSQEVPVWKRLTALPPQKKDSHSHRNIVRGGILVVLLGCALAFFPQDILERFYQNTPLFHKDPLRETESVQEISPAETEPGYSVETELSLGGLELGLTLDKMHEILGKEKGTAPDGAYLFYVYDHVKAGIKDGIIQVLISTDETATTKRGLHEGSTYREVAAAYGTNSTTVDSNDLILYEYTYNTLLSQKGLLQFAVSKSNHRVNYIHVKIPEESALPQAAQIDIDGAKQAFTNYHKALTNKEYQTAFQLLSNGQRQSIGSVSDFRSGCKETISSIVKGLSIASAQPNQVILYYNLLARSRMKNGHVLVQALSGTVTMILEDGHWCIAWDESHATGEHVE